MYHSRFKGSYLEAGYHFGSLLLKKKKKISQQETFVVNDEKRAFVKECIPIYEKFYPEILEEIRGLAKGQEMPYDALCTFLLSMYCFELKNHCTCFAFSHKDHIFFGRNSDFLVQLENLYMNCLYQLHGAYAFCGNTTAFIEMEDGVNEHGLAIGLTFVMTGMRQPGFHAGMLVRYLLEKCQTTKEVIHQIKRLPIASSQVLIVVDASGCMAMIECCSQGIEIIEKRKGFVVATNQFCSPKLMKYKRNDIDDWRSMERLQIATQALKTQSLSFELAQDILSGKYGFMCQYDRSKGADTVWSVIYDIRNKEIYRVEGNPSRKQFKRDTRLKWKSNKLSEEALKR